MVKSENFLLTLLKINPQNLSPPLVGGDEGEGVRLRKFQICLVRLQMKSLCYFIIKRGAKPSLETIGHKRMNKRALENC